MPAPLEMEIRMRFLGLTCSGVEMRINPPVILKLHQSPRQIEATHHAHLEIRLLGKDLSRVFCDFSQMELKMYKRLRDITSFRMKALISRWRDWRAVGFTFKYFGRPPVSFKFAPVGV
jgi:hypothetical protein